MLYAWYSWLVCVWDLILYAYISHAACGLYSFCCCCCWCLPLFSPVGCFEHTRTDSALVCCCQIDCEHYQNQLENYANGNNRYHWIEKRFLGCLNTIRMHSWWIINTMKIHAAERMEGDGVNHKTTGLPNIQLANACPKKCCMQLICVVASASSISTPMKCKMNFETAIFIVQRLNYFKYI